MSKCIKCGKDIPDEESRARYDELMKLGIMPKLVPMCKTCRDWDKLDLNPSVSFENFKKRWVINKDVK
jgi:NAD-dependent SIR2 family protein deacetylase